ncbi:MAG: type I-D CRISPR-associated helicase Cas3' [Anaerolineae bacterium]|nr:type I-D CRISPR-associated helicase Cas3' [Anaerolineae bacterium]
MRIKTLPVYSKLADMADIPSKMAARLPPGWRLSQHQVETYKAVTEGSTEVILNTAMTGDGKSLAAYLPVLMDDYHAFGMYPTIELSRDQARQFEGYRDSFQSSMTHLPLWGAEITRLAEKHGFDFKKRGEWLVAQFKNYGVILTNPDIFNLVMNYRYRTFVHSAVELPYSLGTGYDYFVFDEFHVFEMPQIVSALTAILWLVEHNPSQPPRFVFSSATPEQELIDMVKQAGLESTLIEGTYTTEANPDYRQVLHQTELHLHQLGERENAEDWLTANLDRVVSLWQSATRRRPKGVVIVNSVAAARRITRLLAQELAPHGITVGENTGLTDLERRRLAMECDLIVGTSTIDVGVDFDINLLIFESTEAGNFLQRFGRLGRVRRNEVPFDSYQAHALFSGRTPWIYERLVEGLKQKGVGEGDAVDRHRTLATVVQEAFPPREKFFPYARRWGVLQGAHVIEVLRDCKKGGAYESLAKALEERYGRLFNIPGFKGAKSRYWGVRCKMEGGERVLDEVLSFRGTSPFQVGLWDATVDPPAFRPYDLFFVVQTAQFDVISQDVFEEQLSQRELGLEEFKYVMRGKGDKPLYLKALAFYPERESLVLRLNENLAECPELLGIVCVLSGFRIAEPRTSHALPTVNDVLKRQEVVCCISKHDRRELWRRLRLPPFFPLYRLQDQRGNREYTVAFGKAALMLEPLLWRLRDRDEDEAPIIL